MGQICRLELQKGSNIIPNYLDFWVEDIMPNNGKITSEEFYNIE